MFGIAENYYNDTLMSVKMNYEVETLNLFT